MTHIKKKMKETFILRTVTLNITRGVVHIESIGYEPEDNTYIEYDARQLLEDIPSLYRLAQQAVKKEEEYAIKR